MIRIPHRFIDRLLPNEYIENISTVIIGTFNPGNPNFSLLTNQELQIFEAKSGTNKFQRFNAVRNFYDRPQNRFWKIMDLIANSDFYKERQLNSKNKNGLKYYAGFERDLIFEYQKKFCRNYGVFLTDIVREIEPESFENIYDNFPDKGIENANCNWNTTGIIKLIEQYQPNKIIFNFNVSKSIAKISTELIKIKNRYPEKVFSVLSTSGAAGNSYKALREDWSQHIQAIT